MVIVALGMLAVFGQLNQSASTAIRLRDKTMAEWVALDKITELRLSNDYPAVGTTSDDMPMGYGKWHYEVDIVETGITDLRRADVSVTLAEAPDHPIAKVTGFIVRRPQTAGAPAPAGWEPLDAAGAQSGAAPPGVTPPGIAPPGTTPPGSKSPGVTTP
jgi:general secretion pathway protein I